MKYKDEYLEDNCIANLHRAIIYLEKIKEETGHSNRYTMEIQGITSDLLHLYKSLTENK